MQTTTDIIAGFTKYVIANYTRLPVVIVRGEGSRVWDADGRSYLDLFPGWGVSATGYGHPRVVEAVRAQAGRLMHMPNNFYNELQGRLAEAIVERAFVSQCFFCNSGAEANESALKLARLVGGPKGRTDFITMTGSFHGRTFGALSATAQTKYQDPFKPIVPGFHHVPFGDTKAAEAAMSDRVCAILVEPIQGEGGVNVAPPAYFRRLRELCDAAGALLIFDEVQTGIGRLGTWYGYQDIGVEPDVITLAKALGGGMPIGAMVVKPDYAAFLKPGTHASTYGGNPIACAASLAVFEAIEEEGLLDNVRRMGDALRAKLDALVDEFSIVTAARGAGLMQGIQLGVPGAAIVSRCLERGLIINCTAGAVVRFLPAYTITTDELDEGLAILHDALAEAESELKKA
ncbi:MAG: aspartate aminotransferase family protein [Verrucomicrobia bacterium]|nr:aspartate aminotransferase family protein [Verrucomicrobiota bacterium]